MSDLKLKKIRILLFDGVELLDFAGPLEVFSTAQHLLDENSPLDVKTISSEEIITVSKSKIQIKANIHEENDYFDLLIIPGGIGSRSIIIDEKQLNFVNQLVLKASISASVCTGALILGKLGLLKGLRVTTHYVGVPLLKEIEPGCVIDRSLRYIDQECIITSAGISAGIDMSLYIVEKYFGFDLKNKVQQYMEYNN